jgi:hypothetical protein
MNFKALFIGLVLAVLMVSCFEDDQAVPPYVPPNDVESVFIQNSIYTNQIYFNFSSGSIVRENKNSEWVLAFECLDSGNQIRVNSSDLWGLAHTGSTDMSSDFRDKETYLWESDKADGNPDSTAVGAWMSLDEGEPVYTGEVMLLGKYDGISYTAEKKVQFIKVDEISYVFLVSDLELSAADTVEVLKSESFNYLHYSFENNELKILEPAKDQWDILFTQYFTILFTDDGIPAPYYVRGVWLNPNRVESALDTIIHFSDVNASNALNNEFVSAQDAIGHDWKSVEVDQASNSAEYKVRPGYTYIVRDLENHLYKFRFKSYFNPSGQKGFPSFEYSKLESPPEI